MGQRPTSPSQGQPGALTRGGARPGHAGARPRLRSCARARVAHGDGERRRSEAKLERGNGHAHGVEATTAKLTSGGASRER